MRHWAGSWRSLLVVVALVAMAAVSSGFSEPTRAGAAVDPLETLPAGATWLETLNAWRTASGLPTVTESTATVPSWSTGALNHSKYMIETPDFGHDEDSGGQYATPEGAAAGINSNVAASGNVAKTDRAFVEQWIAAPFHGGGLLDPKLATSGFGSYRRAGAAPYPAAATLDVIRGRTGPAATSCTRPGRW